MTASSILRRFSQCSVITLFCVLPWLAAHGWNDINGSLFAFDLFGVPFADPASAAQAILASTTMGAIPPLSICLGGIIALGIAFFLGRVFCGWMCPYGFISEIIQNLRARILKKTPFKKTHENAFWLKTGIFVSGLIAVAFGFPLISMISFPGDLSLLPLALWQNAGHLVIISICALPILAILLEAIIGRRIWCEYICPQSVALGFSSGILPKIFPGLRIRWNPQKCICGKNSPCRDSCTMGLNPRKAWGPSRRECTMCGECLQTCARYGGALSWRLAIKSASAETDRKVNTEKGAL